MHVDTGHNFPEAIEFRDKRVAELGARLIVASVQESIDKGRVREETGPRASRNRLQTTTLLDARKDSFAASRCRCRNGSLPSIRFRSSRLLSMAMACGAPSGKAALDGPAAMRKLLPDAG
jgi:hypothetical protein